MVFIIYLDGTWKTTLLSSSRFFFLLLPLNTKIYLGNKNNSHRTKQTKGSFFHFGDKKYIYIGVQFMRHQYQHKRISMKWKEKYRSFWYMIKIIIQRKKSTKFPFNWFFFFFESIRSSIVRLHSKEREERKNGLFARHQANKKTHFNLLFSNTIEINRNEQCIDPHTHTTAQIALELKRAI